MFLAHILTSCLLYISNVFNWVFPPLVQSRLDAYCTYWNNHRLRSQPNKLNPSGTSPLHMLEAPDSVRPGARHCGIRVRKELVDQLRQSIGGMAGRELALSFSTPRFQKIADNAYLSLGSPEITLNTAWKVWKAMVNLLQPYV